MTARRLVAAPQAVAGERTCAAWSCAARVIAARVTVAWTILVASPAAQDGLAATSSRASPAATEAEAETETETATETATEAAAAPVDEQPSTAHVRVDAFGWLPQASKVAVLREPVVGFDAPAPYVPGDELSVVDADDGTRVLAPSAVAFGDGAVHAASGDRCWTVDLSALTTPGRYRLVDAAHGEASEVFVVGEHVYDDALRAALRMFLHQRCGEVRAAAWVGDAYADDACHVGPRQDAACVAADGSHDVPLDLRGGWHDAGDYGKYVNFADDPVHDLLSAYEEAPGVFDDALGLPESGNRVPDVLDEVAVELRWMLRMQRPDGGVLHKLHVHGFETASPPSADRAPRVHGPPSASATLSAAGAFAHAARVFSARDDDASRAFGARLRDAALLAWRWIDEHPEAAALDASNAGFASTPAEDDVPARLANRLRAAVHLFALTGDDAFRAWFDGHVGESALVRDAYASPYAVGFVEAVLTYTTLPGASPGLSRELRRVVLASLRAQLAEARDDSPYGAWIRTREITWGSNRTLCEQARLFALACRFGLLRADERPEAERLAAGAIHAVHGSNPLGLCMLTAMQPFGAPSSVRETYHGWFADGTPFDRAGSSASGPPPGFLVGGPNPSWRPDASYDGPPLVPPAGQPPHKAYRDWNAGWPENSWELSECQLAYQASYVALLAHVIARG